MPYAPYTFARTQLSGTLNQNQVLYTVPAGKIAIVRAISIGYGQPASDPFFTLYLAGSTIAYGGCLWQATTIPGTGSRRWVGFYVLYGGDQIVVVPGSAGNGWINITGLLGDGLLNGATPFRALYSQAAGGTRTSFYTSPATGRGSIIKSLAIVNIMNMLSGFDCLITGMPLFGHLQVIGPAGQRDPSHAVFVDDNTFMEPGATLEAEIGGGTGQRVNFYASGVELR